MQSQPVINFGGNVAFLPKYHEAARDEAHLLEILARHRGRQIRAHGSLHSWSQAAQCDEVSIDVGQLNRVQLHIHSPNPTTKVGAGCQVKKISG